MHANKQLVNSENVTLN